MRYFLSSLVLIAGLVAGCMTALHSWQGTFYVSNSKYVVVRNPAHVQKFAAFTELKGKAWNILSRERLMAEAFPIRESNRTGLVFGHFITQDTSGKKFFACDLYSRIQLEFVAEGVMEGGELTRMTVEAPCRANSDLNRMEPVWIPHELILQNKTAPALVLDFPETSVQVTFSNLTTDWPRQWVLQQVSLTEGAERSLRIDFNEIARTAKSPIYLNW